MAQRQLPGQRGPMPTSGGPLHGVVCPYCGHTNDLRNLHSQQLLDTGSGVICDKCHWRAEVVQIQQVMFVTLRPMNQQGQAAPVQIAQQARTISTAEAARLAGRQVPRGARLLPRGRR